MSINIGQLVAQNSDNDCPPPEERGKLTETWSCDEYLEFKKMEQAYEIEAYTIKGIQTFVFTVLILVLLFNRYRGRGGKIGPVPIIVMILCLLNGIFSIIRIHSMFPGLHGRDFNLTLFAIMFEMEGACFFSAVWLFAIKYYETASDIEKMLRLEPGPGMK